MTPAALAPHQVEAVGRILDLLDRHGGALLADEVGLGKSWVAASVAAEFRRRGTRVEVIVPCAIVPQWRDLLLDFGIEAEVITHDSLHGTFDFPGAAPRLLVVDEAHRFRNQVTNRYHALALRCVGSKVLLVTATPICNRLRDLQSLMGLICPDDALLEHRIPSICWSFENADQQQISTVIGEFVVRRGRDVLPEHLQFGSIQRRVVRFAVSDVQDQIEQALRDLRFPLIGAGSAQAALLRQLLWRRLESSAAALLDSVKRQKRFYRRARESLTRGIRLSKADYRTIFGSDEDQVLYQDLLFPELWLTFGRSEDATAVEIDAEVERLSGIESVIIRSADEKTQTFLRLVGDMGGEQILVFTGAVATARELFRACTEARPSALLTSRLRCVKRMSNLTADQVLTAFSRGEARVLVMTDVGAEGLNLQFAGAVIHYDLPWNPVRIEQRNGRIHRIGQRRASVDAIYFIPRRESDRVVMRHLTTKNRIRRGVLDAPHYASPAPRAGWLRCRISRTDPQAVLTSVMESKRLLNDETAELLMRRYRAGTELILRQISGEFFDAGRRDYLVTLLRREREVTGRCDK